MVIFLLFIFESAYINDTWVAPNVVGTFLLFIRCFDQDSFFAPVTVVCVVPISSV
jgi:hypothetical protein